MSTAREISNYAIITLVAVLIWAWAAGETRQRVRTTTLASVPVQLVGAPQDDDEYVVEVEPSHLSNFTISADATLIQQIEAGDVPVTAVLHLNPHEIEARIKFKRISYFMALVSEPNEATRGVQVNAKSGEAADLPIVNLNIQKRRP